ncbi:MAG: SAM-dependent methyltransferase [Deltaproteobacteria bacterium HGW-Deltaproteobacteria-4]|nr:MAG: SAM-dependent methyltransferase [Deltaproteobacteria bacterium HGW-Deltaproteobacteria-4]
MNEFPPCPDLLPLLHPDETLDTLGYGKLQIIQPRQGFRVTIDPVLLASFTRIKAGERWIDLGCGSGVLPLLLASREAGIQMTGIEIDPASADQACRNILLNNLEKQIDIIPGDLRDLRKSHAAQSLDGVITNPPYRRPESGRISIGEQRSTARHELHGSLDDFLDASHYLLKNGGRFYAIYLAERIPELLIKMSAKMIEPKRLRCIHPRRENAANLVLIEGRRNGRPGLTIEPPLFLYEGEGYSEEVRMLAGDFVEKRD